MIWCDLCHISGGLAVEAEYLVTLADRGSQEPMLVIHLCAGCLDLTATYRETQQTWIKRSGGIDSMNAGISAI